MKFQFQRYNIELKDKKQPLLLSFTKKTNPDGTRKTIGLIPELCRLTGVTEEMRSNFRLMRAVSDYTRLDPKERLRKLNNYNSRLMRSQESVNIFKEWGLEMERKIIDVKARVLNPETIIFGGDVRVETNLEADWVRTFLISFYVSFSLFSLSLNFALSLSLYCLKYFYFFLFICPFLLISLFIFIFIQFSLLFISLSLSLSFS